MTNIKHRLITIFISLILVISLTACSINAHNDEPQKTDIKVDYTTGQMLMLIGSQKSRITGIYSDNIWNTALDGSGTTYKSVFLDEMRNFIIEMKLMNLMATDKGMKLTSEEKVAIDKSVDEYMASATSSTLSREEVLQVFEDYTLCYKLVQQVTGTDNQEVSEAEARVMDVQQIVLSDESQSTDTQTTISIDKLYQMVTTDEEDFYKTAATYSEDRDISIKVSKSDYDASIADQVFALEDGQISPVLTVGTKHYIIKCVNSYDEEATALHKEELAMSKKKAAIKTAYDGLVDKYNIEIDASDWKKITEEVDREYTQPDFYTYVKEALGT